MKYLSVSYKSHHHTWTARTGEVKYRAENTGFKLAQAHKHNVDLPPREMAGHIFAATRDQSFISTSNIYNFEEGACRKQRNKIEQNYNTEII
jgi:hypothetical protein